MFGELWSSLWAGLYWVIWRPMLKWILRKVTGKCELLRITYEENESAQRTRRIEKSLRHSKISYLKSLVAESEIDVSSAVERVMEVKLIIPEIHSEFQNAFTVCLRQISGFQQLLQEVEERRKTPFSSDNPDHESLLLSLWQMLMPDTPLEKRLTRQWGEIGFQGEDPKTDFRGMGMLGLDQLVYFSSEYRKEAQQVLSYSHHPQHGFSYAIVGINITGMLHFLISTKKLRVHFYNISNIEPTMEEFHEVYCHLFYEFSKFWMSEKPKDIMEFGRLRDKFSRRVEEKLRDSKTVLISDFQKQKRM